MHHTLKLPGVKHAFHGLAIRQVGLDESESLVAFQNVETRLFQCRVVISIEIVETHDFVASLEQQPRRVETDKTGSPGHEQLHNLRHTVCPDEVLSSSARMCS